MLVAEAFCMLFVIFFPLLSDGPCPSGEYTSDSPAASVHAPGSPSGTPWIASAHLATLVLPPVVLLTLKVSSGIAKWSSWAQGPAQVSAGMLPGELFLSSVGQNPT